MKTNTQRARTNKKSQNRKKEKKNTKLYKTIKK
jgi:hypothetical protein